MADRRYHTLEEAARFLSEPVERVRRRVDDKELPHTVMNGRVMIPALPLRGFYYDYLLKEKKSIASRKSRNETHPLAGSEAPTATPEASTKQDNLIEGEWLPSAFHAARLVGMLAPEIYQLGIEGKVRTSKKGKVRGITAPTSKL